MRLFFYGTMLDPDVRRIVLGGASASVTIHSAVLTGFHRVRAGGGNFPMLVRRSLGRVHGELVEGLRRDDLLRIAHFEGPDYVPSRQRVRDAANRCVFAWVLLPPDKAKASRERWDLRRWQLRDKPRMLPQMEGWMRDYDRFGSHSVDIPWPLRRRLKAWLEAGELEP